MAKQVIVMRKDLQMTKGKMITQGAHASMAVLLRMANNGKSVKEEAPIGYDNYYYSLSLDVTVGSELDEWLRGNFAKVCVYVNSEEELVALYEQAKAAGLPAVLIEDSGLTMFHGVKTKTCIAIGPDNNEKIDAITGHLKLL